MLKYSKNGASLGPFEFLQMLMVSLAVSVSHLFSSSPLLTSGQDGRLAV